MAQEEIKQQASDKILSAAQRRYVALLVAQINSAQVAHDTAKKALEAAQNNADNFILYCAEEMGITLGVGGWEFSSNELAFIHRQAAGNNGNGD